MKVKRVLTTLILLICVLLFLYYENNFITITNVTIKSNKLPQSFNGYKIVHLSDLHSKSFGESQRNLIRKIRNIEPDLIVFTGDLIDSKDYNEEAGIGLMKQIVRIAPVYYVTGNHEWWSGRFDTLEKAIKESGATVLRNAYKKIAKNQDEIFIIGIDDPAASYDRDGEEKLIENEIGTATQGIEEDKRFKILLSHRPEVFSIYSQFSFNLILSGHAHGGQVRLPLIGSIIAPNQGFFPHYTSGKYIEEDSIMVVNRGLGNSIIPQRLFNHPEVIVITLSKD
ncbi:MAG: metallophosphoesterase [Clostridia bacterium]